MNFLLARDSDDPELVDSGCRNFYNHLDRFVEQLEACRNDAEVLGLLRAATESLGATSAYFATFERDESSSGPFSLLLACDPLWGLEYERERCLAIDPWLAYCRVSSEPVRATRIGCRDEAAADMVRRAATFGFRSAIVAPAPAAGSGDLLGMLVLGHTETGHFERASPGLVKVAARGLAMEVREKVAELARLRLLAGATLSALELALLRLSGQGLSSKAIGRATGLSASAVDMRFHRLNGKLNCADRRCSTRLAALGGLI